MNPFIAAESEQSEGSPFKRQWYDSNLPDHRIGQAQAAAWATTKGSPWNAQEQFQQQIQPQPRPPFMPERQMRQINQRSMNDQGTPEDLQALGQHEQAQGIAQDNLGRRLKEGAVNVAQSEMADKALLLSAFIGPGGAGRLQAAGRITPGGRGSLDALNAAQRTWDSMPGASGAERSAATWGSHGWAPADGFGPVHPLSAPFSWTDSSKFGLKDRIVQEMRSHLHEVTPDSMKSIGPHPLRKLVQGADDLFIAEPRLAEMPTKVDLSVNHKGGEFLPRHTDDHVILPGSSQEVRVYGPSPGYLNQVLAHEVLGHAAPIEGGASLTQRGRADRGGQAPIAGTMAEHAHALEASQMRSSLLGMPDGPSKNQLRQMVIQADDLAYEAKRHAGYFGSTHEHFGRAGMMYRNMPFEHVWENPPGKLDTYSGAAWPAGETNFARSYDPFGVGVKLRDYAPPGSPFVKPGE